ncbi:site-specific integrase [Nostoc sp.]|uniref:site-specific integrase n=1 Tax=Nostoc sp. TaxID=1180 RepID=UPI002FF4AD35
MKVDGNGQGKILTQDELRRLFTEGFLTRRDRALFGMCLFTACRVSEALALNMTDMKSGTITFRKSTTKGKHKTRIVDIPPVLDHEFSSIFLCFIFLYEYALTYYDKLM